MPANNPLGYAFAPTFERAEEGMRGGSPQTAGQQPLQVLSYQLPKFRGAGVSPLQSQQMAGSPMASAVLQSVLRTVLGAGQDPASLMGSPIPSRNHDPGGLMGGPGDIGGGSPPGGPTFEGHIDTPPMQNAPPQFGGGGGGGVDPAQWWASMYQPSNPRDDMGVGDWYQVMEAMMDANRRQRQQRRAPNPSIHVEERPRSNGPQHA